MSTPPPTPAGWFDHPTDAELLRYWDGTQWTNHTAPKGVGAPAGVAKGMSKVTKGVLIGVGSIVALSLISGIAAAASGGRQPTAQTAPLETPKPTTPSTEPTPEVTPTSVALPVVVDVALFRNDSFRDLDDFEKDLNDMVTTVNEDGFWRLLSNSAELSFNLGQLQSHKPPTSVSAEWVDGLATLEANVTTITDVITNDDPNVILGAIEAARAQVNVLRGIVERAV